MKDYSTFIAMDTHKKEHRVCLLAGGSDKIVQWSILNDVREIKRMAKCIKKNHPGAKVCYEAGVCGFSLQRQLAAEGIDCVVIAPSLVPSKPGDRIKTDRRDARKLAQLFRAGMLTEVEPPRQEDEAARDICRARQAAHKDLNRIRHQVLKFLLRKGIIFRNGNNWTQKHMHWLKKLTFNIAMEKEVFLSYFAELLHRIERLKTLDRLIEKLAKKDAYKVPVGMLRCFRGIDTITATSVVTELYNFGRFKSAKHTMSFLGLAPSEWSSGEKHKRGSITKAGNKHVRRLLIEAAHHNRHMPYVSKVLRSRRRDQPQWVIDSADRAQHRLHKRYRHLLYNGKAPCKVMAALARELAGFIWAVLYGRYQNESGVDVA